MYINNNNNNMADQTPPTYNNKTSLVLNERGVSGIDVLLFSRNVPDTEEEIAAAMRDPKDIIAGYFIPAKDVDLLITALDNFRRKQKAYKVYCDMFQGCADDPQHLAKVVATELDFEEDLRGKGKKETMPYTLGFDAKLFMGGVRDNHSAMTQVLAAWVAERGSLTMWGIECDLHGSAWTTDRKTAEKFNTWTAQCYIIPTLQILKLL